MRKKVNIRMAGTNDAKAILDIYRSSITDTAVTFEEVVPSLDEFRERIDGILEESPYLVCEIDGEITGYAYASTYRSRASYRWNREVTVYVKPEFQGKNIGTALYAALIPILKEQNYTNLLAVVTLPNEGSVRLHERLGFKACGVFNQVGYKMNRWHQVGWWELFLANPGECPAEPILLRDFHHHSFLGEIMLEASGLVNL